MSDTIQVVANQVPYALARKQCEIREGKLEVDPMVAVTIASQHQSPGVIGRTLAAFSSGCEVDRTELLDDIAATVRHDYNGEWPTELGMLSTFVINYGR